MVGLRIKQLESECSELTKQTENLDKKIEEIETTDKEQQNLDEQKHFDEVDFLKKTNQKVKEELEKLLSGPSGGTQQKK